MNARQYDGVQDVTYMMKSRGESEKVSRGESEKVSRGAKVSNGLLNDEKE